VPALLHATPHPAPETCFPLAHHAAFRAAAMVRFVVFGATIGSNLLEPMIA